MTDRNLMNRWIVSGLMGVMLGVLGVAATASANPPFDRFSASPNERASARERQLGLKRDWLSEKRFRYQAIGTKNAPAAPRGMRYRYVGQETFNTEGKSRHAEFTTIRDQDDFGSLVNEMRATRVVDKFGRAWALESVDEDTLHELVDEYDEEVRRKFGDEEGETDRFIENRPPPEADEIGLVTPVTWSYRDCDGDGDNDSGVWDTESRNRSSSPMTERQAKVLMFSSGGALCSGTMVDDRWLLTAAHCVTNGSGVRDSINGMYACTHGNYQDEATCTFVDQVAVAPGWDGRTGDINDDYAVVKLAKDPGVDWMPISSVTSNSTIEDATAYNSGYPGNYPSTCILNDESPWVSSIIRARSDGSGGQSASPFAVEQYWSKGELFRATSNRIRTRLDSSGGHSGGPIYYYPSGCCGSHFITGVMTTIAERALSKNWTGGPRGSAIRSWVIANTP